MIVVNNVRYKLTSTDVGDTKSFLYTMIVLATDKPQCVVHMVYMKRLMKNNNFRILVRSPFVLQSGLLIARMNVMLKPPYSMTKMKTGTRQLYTPRGS